MQARFHCPSWSTQAVRLRVMSLQNELTAAEVRLPVCAASSICPVAFSSPATLRFPLLARMSLSINYCRQVAHLRTYDLSDWSFVLLWVGNISQHCFLTDCYEATNSG